ncbi:hypothetical protein HanRHA438_Chr09g0384201 [Helianthus annuus]|nr:hypothetical protein HanIR_Chr09g0401661 [Helianthus annuus]KAJ0886860.1 hypothetical protein HanRHA438_Chr09g0384201 [Helianthus annuus]
MNKCNPFLFIKYTSLGSSRSGFEDRRKPPPPAGVSGRWRAVVKGVVSRLFNSGRRRRYGVRVSCCFG